MIDSAQFDAAEMLETALRAAPLAVCACDAQGIVRRWNPAAEALFGWTADEAVGRPIRFIPPSEAHRLASILHGAAGEDDIHCSEVRRRHRDGRLIDVELWTTTLRDDAGRLTGVLKIAADISERKAREAEQERLLGALRERVKELTAIQATTRILQREAASSEQALAEIVRLLPPAFLRPEAAAARIRYSEREFASGRLDADAPCLSASFRTMDGAGGSVEVAYAPHAGASPAECFLPEEQALLDSVAELLGIFLDRDLARSAHHTTESRLKRLIESNILGIAYWQVNGGLSEPNGAFLKLIGATDADGPLRLDWKNLVAPDFLASLKAAQREVALQGDCTPFEVEVLRLDGTHVPVLVGAAAFDDDRESGVCFVADISTLKEVEASLHDSEERYRELFEADITGDFVADGEGRLLACNQSFREMFGFAAEEDAVGLPIDQLFAHADERQTVLDTLRRGERIAYRQIEFVRRDGRPLPARANLSAATDDAGRVVRMQGYLLDETELKSLEVQYRQAQKMEAIGRLAGGVAHDFNNMLTIILGYCELLGDQLPPCHEGHEALHEIDRAAHRAAALTKQLLAFSRQQVLRPRVVDLNQIVDGIRGMLERLLGEDIDLHVALGEGVRTILADAGQLEQVLLNLSINARDAMPDGGKLTIVTRDIRVADGEPHAMFGDLPAGDYLLLSVIDTGCGMDDATLSRIFEPFFTTKEVGRGTGLGLATVYGIVTQSGGQIRVASLIGVGTTFSIAFPAYDGALPVAATQASVSAAVMPRGQDTILLVEDEDSVRQLGQRLLARLGYRVVAARDGAEALEAAARLGRKFDLLITDVVMPRTNGRQVAERLADFLVSPDRVLYVTGHTDNPALRDALSDPQTRLLQKPLSPQVVAATVRRILDERLH